MKTKSLYPIIATSDIQGTIDFYSGVFDYSVKHNLTTPAGSRIVVLTTPKDDEIELIEVTANSPLANQEGLYGFRINVSNMDEAVKELKEKGCTIVSGPFESKSGLNLLIKDNNGVNITLIEHFKKD